VKASRGIHLRSLTEAIDTSTPGGRLIFHVFGALAQFERELIRERTMAGLQAARAKGRIGGRPRKLTDADVRAAKALLADEDVTVAEVAKRLAVSVPTLYRYLPRASSLNPEGSVHNTLNSSC
jgi:DNA invertase Pin-like site-specific DNA recombinase